MQSGIRISNCVVGFLSLLFMTFLILSAAGCQKAPVSETSYPASQDGVIVLGEGSLSFPFTVTDGEGKESQFRIHTDETTVGAALSALNLIDGEKGEYGLYVKTVTGITADYDQDGTYWAFYVNGEYAMTGVDSTAITPDTTYAFKIVKE